MSSPARLEARFRVRALILLGVGALVIGARPSRAAISLPDGFRDEIVVGGLDAPTSFAFLPDGRVLVTEQNTGRVRLIVNGHLAASDPVLTVPAVEPFGERGLLGIAVDPLWPLRPYVYVMFTHTGGHEAILRYRAIGQLADPNGESLTLGAPLTIIDDIRDEYAVHNAGCLRFGLDGCLYASVGDDEVFCDAADSSSLRGAILRLRVDRLPSAGGPQVARAEITPPDNPFVTSPNVNARLVWAFGFRNPFRFQFDPALGTLIAGDVGDQQFEEMDEVGKGEFMGWPWLEGNYPRPRPECPDTLDRAAASRRPLAVEQHLDPVGYAIISAGIYRPAHGGANNWPLEYDTPRGEIFYGQYYQGYLRRLTWDGAAWVRAPAVTGQPNSDDWATGLVSSVDFLDGPDGSLWWLAQFDPSFDDVSGSLHRILYVTPSSSAGDPPISAGESLGALPNPFASSVLLIFRLAGSSPGEVSIYDLCGRRVRTIFRGALASGTSRMSWDGRDDRGREAGAGVYFARIERPGFLSITARLLHVR